MAQYGQIAVDDRLAENKLKNRFAQAGLLVSRIAGIGLWPFLPGASYAEGGFKIALYSMALTLFFLPFQRAKLLAWSIPMATYATFG